MFISITTEVGEETVMDKARIFDDTYHHYLSNLEQVDLTKRAITLGAKVSGDTLHVSFYDRELSISSSGISSEGHEQIPFPVKVVLCRYVLMCPDDMPQLDARLVNYRDFRYAAPLLNYFTTNTSKTLEIAHSGEIEKLHQKCVQTGGMEAITVGYDLSMKFQALPRIPIYLYFNDADDEFPAKCSILFQADAGQFLDMECLAITGTYLTSRLLEP